MHIDRAIIHNYRSLTDVDIQFNSETNIIVGDNEAGKSTLLEAISLALTGQIGGRSIIYDLHPHLFNQAAVLEFIASLTARQNPDPPYFEIELYFNDDEEFARLKGLNNTRREDIPGLALRAEFNDAFSREYARYIAIADQVTTVPVEYYKVTWRDFAGNDLSPRARPLKVAVIDTGDLRYNAGPNRYIIDAVSDFLQPNDRAQLALSYRKMRESFQADEGVAEINRRLAEKQGEISDKTMSVSLDSTAKGSWEAGIVTNLDGIPFPFIGKGEQSSIKVRLSMDAASDVQIFLIEEPENHLTFTNLNRLVTKIRDRADGRQAFITTHSSFVLNKLDPGNVLLFRNNRSITLNELTPETRGYFLKLPGHDTLRLILSSKAILVEGPSDELVVQRAFKQEHDQLPIEAGVDVISVQSLAFKRFLEIARALGVETHVVTDNDGDIARVRQSYEEYDEVDNITVHYDDDEQCYTLEKTLLRENGRNSLVTILNHQADSDEGLLAYMKNNKTECALRIFESDRDIEIPQYIKDAIS